MICSTSMGHIFYTENTNTDINLHKLEDIRHPHTTLAVLHMTTHYLCFTEVRGVTSTYRARSFLSCSSKKFPDLYLVAFRLFWFHSLRARATRTLHYTRDRLTENLWQHFLQHLPNVPPGQATPLQIQHEVK